MRAGPPSAFVVLVVPLAAAVAVVLVGRALLRAGRATAGSSVRHRLAGEEPTPPPAWFVASVEALELGLAPGRAWPWAVRAGAGAAVLLAVRAPIAFLVVLVVATGAGAVRRRSGGWRSALGLERSLPEALDDVVAAMASGASLLQGLEVASRRAGPIGAELRHVLQQRAHGIGLQPALDEWAGRWPGSGVGLVADALALAGASGGSQVGALRSVGATLREREALRREASALAAQAQLSARVLVVTPVAFAGVVALLDHRIAAFLLADPMGWACVVAGAGLDAVGAWWMRRLVGAVS